MRLLKIVMAAAIVVTATAAEARTKKHHIDANGNSAAKVCTHSGKCVSVAPSAQGKLQCVVNYVEGHGVRITSMRGFGSASVSGSQHPHGRALDINQTRRDVTKPRVPREVSNAAADRCGVISGARWHDADNGHWNLPTQYASRHHRRRLAHAY